MSETTTTPATTTYIPLNPVPVCEGRNVECTALVHRPTCSRATWQERSEDPEAAAVNFYARQIQAHAHGIRGLKVLALAPGAGDGIPDACRRLALNHYGIITAAQLVLSFEAQTRPALRGMLGEARDRVRAAEADLRRMMASTGHGA